MSNETPEILRLEYKAQWYGSKLVVVDRFFPPSKTCSNCGLCIRI
ncbi:zinc ribbon domain-containing protein [Okeania sp. SIO3I5]